MKNKLTPCAIAVLISLIITGCNKDTPSNVHLTDTPLNLSLLNYVDPMIGTAGSGHTFPGAVVPAGMVQLSPDTFIGSEIGHESGENPWHSASGYWDKSRYGPNGQIFNTDLSLYGFSHTHLSGTGATDLGDILVLPFSNQTDADLNAFDKINEVAKAGYYKTKLNKGEIEVELTTTKRVGLHRYTFKAGTDRNIKLDLGHTLKNNNGATLKNKMEIIDAYTIRGLKSSTGWFQGQEHQGQDVYYYAKFNLPIAKALLSENGGAPARDMRFNSVYTGTDLASHLNFGIGSEALEVRVGISPVNWHGAQKNLEAEAPTFDFEGVKRNAEKAWAQKLNTIQVEGGTETEKKIFYTGLYHMMIAPIEFYDVDGRYVDMLGTIRTLKEGDTPNYSIYSTWDTFRAVHPLWTIIDPKQASLYVKDLIRKSNDEFGMLPKWEGHGSETGTMIGYPSTAIVGDAVTKGLVDAKEALDASIKSAYYRPHDFSQIKDEILTSLMPGQLNYHIKEKCVRAPNWNSVSYSLEYSYYDWTIAEMAKAAGDMALYNEFKARSEYSLNHWDPTFGFFVPTVQVNQNDCAFLAGSGAQWDTENYPNGFDPYVANPMFFTEGNAWQWQWTFMQDFDKLTEVMGGTEGFNQKLNNLFSADPNQGDQHQDMTGYIGQYIHGNEPSHHVIYLYNRTKESYKVQEYIDRVYDEFYTTSPDGIIGNEDVGQMSAWYIMSALGFYQVSPTDPTYSIGRPMFDKATIAMGGGTFTVIAENNGPDNLYVQSVTINGKPLNKYNTFKHEEFVQGGVLRFVMTNNKAEAMAANI